MIIRQLRKTKIYQTQKSDGDCSSVEAFHSITNDAVFPTIVEMNQVHDTSLAIIDEKTPHAAKITGTDGLITNRKNIALMIKTADCLPVILYDPKQEAIAALHAGWQGLTKGILQNAVNAMISQYNTNPNDVMAHIGPCVHECCYTFSDKPSQANLPDWKKFINNSDGLWRINLPGFAQEQLIKLGLDPGNIQKDDSCTHHNEDSWYSYSRQKKTKEPTGLMSTVVQLH